MANPSWAPRVLVRTKVNNPSISSRVKQVTVKTRPNIYLRLGPISTTYARSNGTTSLTSLGLKAGVLVDETNTGVRRRKPGSSWIDPTGYTFERKDWRAAVGTCQYMPSGYPNQYGQLYKGVVGTLSGDTQTRFSLDNALNPTLLEYDAKLDNGLRNVALIAARNKLKTTSVDLGVAFAERKQTAGLVAETATRIGNSFRHLSRGNTRRAMDELGITSKRRQPRGSNVPKKWLELQYGWNPLLSDVYGATDSLAKRTRDDWRITAKATRSLKQEFSSEWDYQGPGWGVVKVDVRKSVFVRIDCVPQNEVLISLSSLGILNPLNVAWERVPYSFVVDWFLPIGNYLDSLDAMLGYTCRGFSSSLLVRADWVITGKSGSWGSNKVVNNYTGGKRMVYLSRQAGTSTPIPTPPSFKDPRSLGHMANALALLAGAFGRR